MSTQERSPSAVLAGTALEPWRTGAKDATALQSDCNIVQGMRQSPVSANVDGIPSELKALCQWVLWRSETRDGKPTKVPYQPNGFAASVDNPVTWSTFGRVTQVMEHYNGIGIVLAGGLAGVDIDHCINGDGIPNDTARDVVSRLNSYTEISPSGHGLHTIVFGELPDGKRRDDSKGIEMYKSQPDNSRGRYFTVTGNHLAGTPTTVEHRDAELAALHHEMFGDPKPATPQVTPQPVTLGDKELLDKAMAAENGDKFYRLWLGDTSDYIGADGQPDDSRADFGLCDFLAFYTGKDAGRMDSLFRQSGLMRDKWDSRRGSRTYGQVTITECLASYTGTTYHQSHAEVPMPEEPVFPQEEEPPTPPQQVKPTIKTLSADTILETSWPVPVWAIPNILTAGLGILAGVPKVGKSWLALQIAQAVAAGGRVFGEKVAQGNVLYVALEDSPRRLQDRMAKQGWPKGLAADFITIGEFPKQIGDLRKGGADKLAAFIQERGYSLVVIDTLARSVGGDQLDYQQMTRGLTPLQEMAHAKNCCVLLLDHHKKPNGMISDVISDILGSTAKGATADTALGLYRERGKAGAKLAITGRDVEEKTLALTFDRVTGCWQFDGDADALELTDSRQQLLAAIGGLGKATIPDIVEATGRNKGTLYRVLQDMVTAGLLSTVAGSRGVVYYIKENVEREK